MTPRTDGQELLGTFGDEDEFDYQDADSLLGAAIPTISWKDAKVGDKVEGTIEAVDTSNQTKMETGEPLTFADGTVRRQVILTLQTKLHENDDDDGRRRLFVKGAMIKSFREAIAKAKAKGPRVGGTVKVTFTGEGEARGNLNAPKLFSVVYVKP